MGRDIKAEILTLLAQIGTNGATITELERNISLERHTLSKYLSLLNKEGYLKYKAVGKAKVWFINNVPLKTLFSSLPENMSFTEKLLSDLITTIPVGVVVIDKDYNILFTNDYISDKYGKLEGEKFYKAMLDHANPLKLKEINRIIDSMANSAEFNLNDRNDFVLEVKASKMVNPDKTYSIILIIEDVTDTKRAQERLQSSEERYHDLYMNAPIGYHIAGPDKTITSINHTWSDIFGYSKSEVVGKRTFKDFVVPAEQEKFDEEWDRMMQSREMVVSEYTAKHKRGHKIAIRRMMIAKYDEKGNFIHTRSAIIDITERRKAQEELRQSRNELRSVLHNVPDIISRFDGGFQYTYVNPSVRSLLGYEPDQIIGKTPKELLDINPEFFNPMQKMVRKVFETKETARGEFYASTPFGRRFFEARLIPEFERGKAETVLAVIRDITEAKELQLKLNESNKYLADIKFALDESAIVAVTDAAGTIIYVNDKFCKISKYTREELIGKTHSIINSGYHDEKFFKDLWDTIGSGNVWRGVIRNRAKDGTIYWVDTTITPFLDSKGVPYQYIAIRHELPHMKEEKNKPANR